jgi:hypothetical protein
MKVALRCLLIGLTPLAGAHDGHGLASPHWHATDTLGFIVLGVAVAAALWASRRK